MEIGEKLRLLRRKKKMTQIMLSEASTVSQQAISNIESGRNAPSEQTLRLLSSALGCSINDFFTDQPENKPVGLTSQERELLHMFRQLNQDGRQLVMDHLELILAKPALRQAERIANVE